MPPRPIPPPRDPNYAKYERRVILAVMINFAAFFVLTMVLGGDALNGGIENGVHYLSAQGDRTAVHPKIYYLSLTHGSIALGSVFLLVGYSIVAMVLRMRVR